MNEVSSPAFSSKRQDALKGKIFEALDLQEGNLLSALEAQWVHRYGLATLPNRCISSNSSCEVVLNEQNPVLKQPRLEITSSEESSQYKTLELEDKTLDSIFPKPSIPKPNDLLIDSDSEVNSSATEELQQTTKLIVQEHSLEKCVAPPPPPTLNHLRRWLPSSQGELPKAS